MVWNASRPADSDRIRLSAGLIRDNWTAIEEGTVPYDALSLENQTLTIPPLANHNRIYGYTNVRSGQVELYSINPANQGVYLTEGGKLGSANQDAIFYTAQMSYLTYDNSFFYTGSLMPTARISVSSNGSGSMAVNMSVTRTGTGRYTLTIPAGILTVNSYVLMCQPRYNASTNSVFIDVVSKPNISAGSATVIQVEMVARSDGGKVDSPFDAVIIGGRP